MLESVRRTTAAASTGKAKGDALAADAVLSVIHGLRRSGIQPQLQGIRCRKADQTVQMMALGSSSKAWVAKAASITLRLAALNP